MADGISGTPGAGEEVVDEDEPWHRRILLPRDVLAKSPSAKAEIDEEVEAAHRRWGCELAQEAGILLRCPQVVMCTSQTLLQRFYYRKPLTRFDAMSVAMACTLLAIKLEETKKKARDVALIFYRMYQRRRGLPAEDIDPEGPAIAALKEEMLRVEGYLLRDLGFGFYNAMDHPHKLILYFVRVLNLDEPTVQKAWNYLNDALRTDVCLRYRSEVIVCAAIYMAARGVGVKLPESPPWWAVFKCRYSDIGEVCNIVLSLYVRPKTVWLEPLAKHSIFAPGEAVRRLDPAVTAVSAVAEALEGVGAGGEAAEAVATAAVAAAAASAESNGRPEAEGAEADVGSVATGEAGAAEVPIDQEGSEMQVEAVANGGDAAAAAGEEGAPAKDVKPRENGTAAAPSAAEAKPSESGSRESGAARDGSASRGTRERRSPSPPGNRTSGRDASSREVQRSRGGSRERRDGDRYRDLGRDRRYDDGARRHRRSSRSRSRERSRGADVRGGGYSRNRWR